MHRLRASQSNTHQTILSWNCCARLLFPRLILTPLTRTRDLSTTLTGPLLRLITCHILARTPTTLASQSHPFQRAPCHTIPHPLPRPHRLRLPETTKPHPPPAAMSSNSLPPRMLGSSRTSARPLRPHVTCLTFLPSPWASSCPTFCTSSTPGACLYRTAVIFCALPAIRASVCHAPTLPRVVRTKWCTKTAPTRGLRPAR